MNADWFGEIDMDVDSHCFYVRYLKILLLLLLLYYHFDRSVADIWFQAIDVNVSGNSRTLFRGHLYRVVQKIWPLWISTFALNFAACSSYLTIHACCDLAVNLS